MKQKWEVCGKLPENNTPCKHNIKGSLCIVNIWSKREHNLAKCNEEAEQYRSKSAHIVSLDDFSRIAWLVYTCFKII